MSAREVTYRPGAAVIPRRADGAVLVGRRTPSARSYVGYLAFPGGGQDAPDETLPLLTDASDGGRAARGCAMRELGEETGRWLVVDAHGDKPSAELAERFLAHVSVEDHPPLGPLLAELGLVFDDRQLIALRQWFTSDHRPRQFAVQQFLLPLDEDQALISAPHDELDDIRWRDPKEIEAAWTTGEAFLLPPIRHVVTTLAAHAADDEPALVAALCDVPPKGAPRARDIVAGVGVQPFRTPTLPPATHTNTVLVGTGDFLIVDPATPYPEERERFDALMTSLAERGRKPKAIVLTHHHVDHASDAERVAEHYGLEVWAHEKTDALVDVAVARHLAAGDVLSVDGPTPQRWQVHFTPGHAPGHICLFELTSGVLVAGDMVAAVGSILIDPSEGHMGTYLESLGALAALPVKGLVPSHGALLASGVDRLKEQIAHRRQRQDQVAQALAAHPGGAAPIDLVPGIYGDELPQAAWPMAALSVHAALQLLVEEGGAIEAEGRYRPVA